MLNLVWNCCFWPSLPSKSYIRAKNRVWCQMKNAEAHNDCMNIPYRIGIFSEHFWFLQIRNDHFASTALKCFFTLLISHFKIWPNEVMKYFFCNRLIRYFRMFATLRGFRVHIIEYFMLLSINEWRLECIYVFFDLMASSRYSYIH